MISKSASCPHCGRKLNSYTVDTASTQRTGGTCPGCGKHRVCENYEIGGAGERIPTAPVPPRKDISGKTRKNNNII